MRNWREYVEKCAHCEAEKSIYFCRTRGCDFSTHSLGEIQGHTSWCGRHEEGDNCRCEKCFNSSTGQK